MDIDKDRGGLPWPFIGHLFTIMGYDHNGYALQLANRGLEALRANGQFYQWYGGAYDILQAAAVLRSFRGTTLDKTRMAREAMLMAGWPLPRIEDLELMIRALDDRDASCCFRGHEAEGRPFTGGLFVLRDVEVVPLVLPETMGDCQYPFVELHETSKGAGGRELHKVFQAMHRHMADCGSSYVGWSCVYSAALREHVYVTRLVSDAMQYAISRNYCKASYDDDAEGMARAPSETAAGGAKAADTGS